MNSLIWYSYHVHWMHTASSSQHSNISLEWKHIQSSKLCRTSNIDCIESTREGFRNIKLRYISNNIAILGTKEKTFVVTNKTEKWKTQVVDHYTYTQVSWGRNDEKLDVFHSSLFYNRSQTRVGRRGNFRSRFHSLPLSPLLVVYLPLWKFSKTVFLFLLVVLLLTRAAPWNCDFHRQRLSSRNKGEYQAVSSESWGWLCWAGNAIHNKKKTTFHSRLSVHTQFSSSLSVGCSENSQPISLSLCEAECSSSEHLCASTGSTTCFMLFLYMMSVDCMKRNFGIAVDPSSFICCTSPC